MKSLYKYGELMMWLVLGSIFPVMFIWENFDMPRASIFYWAIPAFMLSTIGFILNGKQNKIDSKKRRDDFEAMNARHRKMLGEE